MATQRIFTNELLDCIQSLIYDNLRVSMSLKLIQKGGIEFYPAIENIANDCPAVFIKPTDIIIEPHDQNLNLINTYNFRIVYVKQFSDNTEVIELIHSEINQIVELLIDNLKMPTFSKWDQVISFLPTRIETESREDMVVSLQEKDLMAIAIEAKVVMYSAR